MLSSTVLNFWLFLRKSHPGWFRTQNQSGVALPLVVVTIVLATTIVVSATYSSYISGRLNASLEQSLRAEYLVKSALNLARVLIQADPTDEDNPEDPWKPFEHGMSIPSEILDIDENNVKIDLEISPLSAKLPLRCLLEYNSNNTTWLDNFKKLFQLLGFDEDEQAELNGIFAGRVFKSSELVANLVDYMDRDSQSLSISGYTGIEDQLPVGVFKNKPIARESELGVIPGFTPARLQQLLPYVVAGIRCGININSASAMVLESLHPDINKSHVEAIISYRQSQNGPFKSQNDLGNLNLVPASASSFIQTYIDLSSKRFSVLAKAQFSANTTFLRAILKTEGTKGALPQITLLELY